MEEFVGKGNIGGVVQNCKITLCQISLKRASHEIKKLGIALFMNSILQIRIARVFAYLVVQHWQEPPKSRQDYASVSKERITVDIA